jgi:uncharacterized protein YcaQ
MTRFTRAKLLEHKRNQAWMMHINGMKQWDIAHELDVTQMIKQAAKEHPVSSLSIEERMAISEERWNISEAEIRTEIAKQLETGVRTVKRITDPMGRMQVEETIEHKVDPALLRALSTHHDRRARQLNNQLSPDNTVQAVNVNVVRDFLQQGDTTAGKLSPEQWNQKTIDV